MKLVTITIQFFFRHIQGLHLMYSQVTWLLMSSRTQVQQQIILDLDYLPDCRSVSYGYGRIYLFISCKE